MSDQATCDHKFVDSKACRKCKWIPILDWQAGKPQNPTEFPPLTAEQQVYLEVATYFESQYGSDESRTGVLRALVQWAREKAKDSPPEFDGPATPPAVVIDAERLMVQLAGCLCAAEGHIKGTNRATRGMYGWSPAYQAVLELRERHDEIIERRGCLMGPGRGDCLHYIGLPIARNSVTTDEYGRPHGWCEMCWRAQQLTEIREKYDRLDEEMKDLIAEGIVVAEDPDAP